MPRRQKGIRSKRSETPCAQPSAWIESRKSIAPAGRHAAAGQLLSNQISSSTPDLGVTGNGPELHLAIPSPRIRMDNDGAFSLYLPVLKLLEPHLRDGAFVIGDNALERRDTSTMCATRRTAICR